MAFQLKDFVSITASMLNHIRGTTTKITDLIPGSVTRTLVEAPAVEIEELYLQMFNGLREAIPVAVFQSFNFGKLPSKYARGYVTVMRSSTTTSITVPAGTIFSSNDGREYLSSEAVEWAIGSAMVTIQVIASAPGLAYNIASDTIVQSPLFDDSYTISNGEINTGRDIETDDEQKARFANFVASLSRGTVVACRSAAASATINDDAGNIKEYVTRTGYTEISGYVKIFIYSSAGIPSSALLSRAQMIMDGWTDVDTGEIIEGYRSGGIRVDVASMVERPIPLSVRVKTLEGYQLNPALMQSITNQFTTLLSTISTGDVLYPDRIENTLLSVAGVKSILISTTENIICGQNEVLTSGAVTVTAL